MRTPKISSANVLTLLLVLFIFMTMFTGESR